MNNQMPARADTAQITGVLASHAETHESACQFAENIASDLEKILSGVLGAVPTPIPSHGQAGQQGSATLAATYAQQFAVRNSRMAHALDRLNDLKNRLAEAF